MIKIRRAVAQDIAGVRQVAAIAWHHTYEKTMLPATRDQVLAGFYSQEGLIKSLQNPEIVLLVAEHDGAIVGFSQALPRPQSGYEVNRTYILPQYQRQGIGKQLFKGLASELPGEMFWVIIEKHNQAAISFYQGLGFKLQREFPLPLFGETLPFVEMSYQNKISRKK